MTNPPLEWRRGWRMRWYGMCFGWWWKRVTYWESTDSLYRVDQPWPYDRTKWYWEREGRELVGNRICYRFAADAMRMAERDAGYFGGGRLSGEWSP